MIEFGPDICANPDAALSREWLETNGLGGFACSTIIGLNTRRYHGLLTAAAFGLVLGLLFMGGGWWRGSSGAAQLLPASRAAARSVVKSSRTPGLGMAATATRSSGDSESRNRFAPAATIWCCVLRMCS